MELKEGDQGVAILALLLPNEENCCSTEVMYKLVALGTIGGAKMAVSRLFCSSSKWILHVNDQQEVSLSVVVAYRCDLATTQRMSSLERVHSNILTAVGASTVLAGARVSAALEIGFPAWWDW